MTRAVVTLIKNYLFRISCIILFVTQFIFSFQFIFNEVGTINNVLIMSSIMIQLSLYLFFLIGLNHSVESIIKDVSLLFIRVLFTTLLLISYLYFAAVHTQDMINMKDWLRFIFIFWVLPMFYLSLSGMLMSYMNRYLKVFIFLFFPLIVGPFNYLLLGEDFSKYISVFKSNPFTIFHPMYGLPVEPFYLTRNLFFVTFIFICLLIQNKYITFQYFKALKLTAISLVIVFFIWGLVKDQQVLLWGEEKESITMVSQRYNYLDNLPDTQAFTLRSITGDIEINHKLSADLTANFINTDDTERNYLQFSLYQDFKVEEIRNKTGEELIYTRNGDILTVYTDKINGYENYEIQIKYSGTSSPLYPANGNAIFLPSSFSWIPSDHLENSFSPISEISIHRNTVKNKDKVNYEVDLTIENDKYLYTNLNEVTKSNHYVGETNGVTIVSTDLNNINKNDSSFITSKHWNLNTNDLLNLKEKIHAYSGFISENLDIKHLETPNEIIIMPITYHTDLLTQENIWYFDNHIIISFPYFYEIQGGELASGFWEEDILVGLTSALTWKYEGVNPKNLNPAIFFDLAFVAFYLSVEEENNEFINQLIISSSEFREENQAFVEVQSLIQNKEFKRLSNFFSQLNYKLQETNGDITWEEIQFLLSDTSN